MPSPADERWIAEIEGARDDALRGEVLSRLEAEHLSVDFVARLADEVLRKVRSDAPAALALARASTAVAERLGDDRARALGARALGNALYATESYGEAVASYARAVDLFEGLGDRLEAARTLSASLQSHILLGRYDVALEAAERARAIFEKLGEQKRLAGLDINVGNLYHRQDRFEEALELYERAYRELTGPASGGGDPTVAEAVAAALSNIAGCHIMLNDFPRALEFHREARDVCEAQGMTRLVAQADYNLSYMYFLRGEYSESIEMLNLARQLFRETGDVYHTALCDMDQAEIYLELNLHSEAERLARRAYSRFREIQTGYEAAKSLALEAIAAANRGSVYRSLGLFDKARAGFERESNKVWPSVIDLYRASVLLDQGRLFEASRFARSALTFFDAQRIEAKAAVARLLLAEIGLEIGDLEGARRQAERALAQSRELAAPLVAYQARYLIGRVEESLDDLDRASESYEQAASILESLRSSLHREEMKIAFMKNRQGVYEALVDLKLRGDDGESSAEEALVLMERAKARGLIDLILGSLRGRPGMGGESELARRVQSLREELNWYYRRIEREQLGREEFDPERVDKLYRSARAREDELLEALREMPAQQDAASPLGRNAPVSVARIRRALGPERALVEYFVARGRVYACVLGEDECAALPIAVSEHVRDLVQRLQFQLSRFQLPAGHVEAVRPSIEESTRVHLEELHRSLIAPIAAHIVGRDLVIVPHGFMHYVPFHALYDGTRYLIDDYTISYAPSASVFVHCEDLPEIGPSGAGRSLVLGVSDDGAPHILEEVHAVAASLHDSELFLEGGASFEVLKERGPGRRVLHIATHGTFRRDNPLFSAIRLGDSHLSLYDLYELELPVELVTVSACATGLSAVVEGDEILGLVRGLLYAGARSLVVSLWNVQDRATASLMRSFYGHLAAGMDRAAALRCAMVDQKNKTPQPFFWAPYLIVGRVGPL